MSSTAINREMDAADAYPLSLGRGTGFTQREFARRLNAYLRKKKIPKITLGGGPREDQSPWKDKGKPEGESPKSPAWKIAVDVWGQL